MQNINKDLKAELSEQIPLSDSRYEQVKRGEHAVFRFAKVFYAAHHTDPRSFSKSYNLFKYSGNELDLLPGKRGPKYGSRRPSPKDEQQVLNLRSRGCNKYEIASQIKQKSDNFSPSPSGVYNILRRHSKNRLRVVEKEKKRKISKERMGKLGHINNCHHLSKSVIRGQHRNVYLLCVSDDYPLVAWTQVMEDITAF